MQYKVLFLALAVLAAACQPPATGADTAAETSIEPRKASATAETDPSMHDGANDPAIWIDRNSPADSLILGAVSEGGIELYGLDGGIVGSVSGRPFTLVDVHYEFPLGGASSDIAVAYDSAVAELLTFAMDPDPRVLRDVTASPIRAEAEIEGLCLYRSPLSAKFYAFALGGGMIQQWELFASGEKISARRVRNIPAGLGAAHCVAQDRTASLFYAQETVGLWKLNAEPESEAVPEAIDLAQPFGSFSGDIKGVAIVELADMGGYLLASDADVSLIQVYSLESLERVAAVNIGPGDNIDGVEESEGLVAASFALPGALGGGVVILSDDDNDGEHTNFKIVAWQDLAGSSGLESLAAYDPTTGFKRTAKTVSPGVETAPVQTFGDAADDPAIWVHPSDPSLSLVIGTQKKHGLNVYDLAGELVQSLPDGRLNNVDLRYGFQLGEQQIDIVAASNRTTDSISLYRVDVASRTLVNVADGIIDTGMNDPYGLCMHRSKGGDYYVIVNDTDGVVKQWQLEDSGTQSISARMVREFQMGSQTEGCVADDGTGALYIGEEDVGFWKYSAAPDGGDARTLVDNVDDGNLTADVEGMAIHYGPGTKGYLVVSNQGADNYALYERDGDNRFLGIFHVVADEASGIDGISETDGLDVSSANLGPAFPHGVFVAQDGRNITPDEKQNFKYVPWERIANEMGLELMQGYDPRAARTE
jgi:3-phytase